MRVTSAVRLFAAMAALTACADAGGQVSQETIRFKTGDLEFEGTLRVPHGATSAPLLIVYHAANGGSSDFPFYDHLKKEIPESGIATFLFDRRGSGNPGDFNSASFEDLAKDGLAALGRLASDARIDRDRIGAYGISQGGWIAPIAANLSSEIDFVISVSGPGVTPARQMDYGAAYHLREAGYGDDVVRSALDLRAKVNAYYRRPQDMEALQSYIDGFRNEPWFDLAFLPRGGRLPEDPAATKWLTEMDFDPVKNLRALRAPMLAVFGANDRWVPIQESVDAIRAAVPDGTTVDFHISEASGHLMSGAPEPPDYNGERPADPAYVKAMIDWIEARK